MKKKRIMLKTTIALFYSLLGFTSRAVCPDSSKKETIQDCPWAEVTRLLSNETDFAIMKATLKKQIPGFIEHFEKDGAQKDLHQLWGLSSNIDESHRTDGLKTVPENLLRFFVSVWGVPYRADFTQGHAGLTHTYGYLFSNLQTPFGYKRARYVSGEIETGFGLTPGIFSGLPPDGTLFSNLTEFAGTIAFRNDPSSLIKIRKTTLTSYDYSQLRPRRLLETVKTDLLYLELRTDIVPFNHSVSGSSNTALLIYSLVYTHKKFQKQTPKLITVFPVDDQFAKNIFRADGLGDNVAIKLKYNAVLEPAFSGELKGKRSIE